VRARLVAILDQLARLGEYSYESVLAAGYWHESDLGVTPESTDADRTSFIRGPELTQAPTDSLD